MPQKGRLHLTHTDLTDKKAQSMKQWPFTLLCPATAFLEPFTFLLTKLGILSMSTLPICLSGKFKRLANVMNDEMSADCCAVSTGPFHSEPIRVWISLPISVKYCWNESRMPCFNDSWSLLLVENDDDTDGCW